MKMAFVASLQEANQQKTCCMKQGQRVRVSVFVNIMFMWWMKLLLLVVW
jgi:hypothetical protein